MKNKIALFLTIACLMIKGIRAECRAGFASVTKDDSEYKIVLDNESCPAGWFEDTFGKYAIDSDTGKTWTDTKGTYYISSMCAY